MEKRIYSTEPKERKFMELRKIQIVKKKEPRMNERPPV